VLWIDLLVQWSEGKPNERIIGIAVLRFSDEQILKDMENGADRVLYLGV
jgi:hypothetical protein